MNLLESANCIVCGLNIDPEVALLNTGVDDCCDRCSLERRSEYRRIKGIIDESTVYGNDCRDGRCEF